MHCPPSSDEFPVKTVAMWNIFRNRHSSETPPTRWSTVAIVDIRASYAIAEAYASRRIDLSTSRTHAIDHRWRKSMNNGKVIVENNSEEPARKTVTEAQHAASSIDRPMAHCR
ncbi:hypothetical protein EVAR_46884_1 [Eumeta japonica]|uniref:Uncharacterized protein n=1 Tax=Eumeta variegata TaxID=151549 RepID=A0A4C1YFI4_EUMVA|nr:hypothetical protein EVAR_46884_1 [Eumeta japonica]